MIETERLWLRQWRDSDRDEFAIINADPRVGHWIGGTLDRAQSDAMIDRISAHIARHGFGFWAAESKADGKLVGMIGVRELPESPPGPCFEMGWRLAWDAWGRGLASEGARAALSWGLANIDTPEIVAFTARLNLRSQAVMRRIDMIHAPDRDFDHPGLPEGHLLRPHVVFVARGA